MRAKIIFILLTIFFLSWAAATWALTTEELLRLKKLGLSEEIILVMVENDYKEVDKISQLKQAGFKDESILAIIKSDLKKTSSSEATEQKSIKEVSAKKVDFETTARIMILWFMIYRGDTVLQNNQTIDDAKVAISGNTIKFEWKERELGLLNVFIGKPFKSPFDWDISTDDTFASGREEGYRYKLKSALGHKGNPGTDNSHFWVVYLEPKDLKLSDYIKAGLQRSK